MACREKLGGLGFADLARLGGMMVEAWQKAVNAAKDNAMCREIFKDKAVSVIAITESVYHGYSALT